MSSSQYAEEKSSGRNWTDEEKDLVWEQVCKIKQDGLPLTEAFRQISKMLPHRSEAAIGMLYYNVLRKERDEEPVKPQQSSNPSQGKSQSKPKRDIKVDNDLIEAFQGLPEYIHKLHQRMEQLEQQLKQPSVDSIAKALLHLADGYRQTDNANTQIAELESQIATLTQENQELRAKLKQVEQSYQDALGIYEMFTNMASISQIMSLGDFKQQMKTTLDKWGNVLKVSLERVEEG